MFDFMEVASHETLPPNEALKLHQVTWLSAKSSESPTLSFASQDGRPSSIRLNQTVCAGMKHHGHSARDRNLILTFQPKVQPKSKLSKCVDCEGRTPGHKLESSFITEEASTARASCVKHTLHCFKPHKCEIVFSMS